MKLLICGKGGSGKSTLSVLLALGFRRAGRRVRLLDADESNAGLHRLLGVPAPRSLLEHMGGKSGLRQKTAPTFPGGPAAPMFPAALSFDDLPQPCVAEANGIALAEVGKIVHFGEGCACPMGGLVRALLESLQVAGDETLLIDTAAGIEHFGRRIDGYVDGVLGVVDPTFQSIELARRILDLAAEAGKPASLVLNKVDAAEADLIRGAIDAAPILAAIGNDPDIFRASLEGRPLKVIPSAVEGICRKMVADAQPVLTRPGMRL